MIAAVIIYGSVAFFLLMMMPIFLDEFDADFSFSEGVAIIFLWPIVLVGLVIKGFLDLIKRLW